MWVRVSNEEIAQYGWVEIGKCQLLAQAAVSLIRMMPRNPGAIGGIAMWYASAAAATGCDTSGVAPISSFPVTFLQPNKKKFIVITAVTALD